MTLARALILQGLAMVIGVLLFVVLDLTTSPADIGDHRTGQLAFAWLIVAAMFSGFVFRREDGAAAIAGFAAGAAGLAVVSLVRHLWYVAPPPYVFAWLVCGSLLTAVTNTMRVSLHARRGS